MMPAVNGWRAALAALLFLTPCLSPAAEDLPGAAKELARKTLGFAGGRVPVDASYRNLSSLPDSDLADVRREFEEILPSIVPAVMDVRITLSESASQYFLVEEARRGDESQVWIAGWPRSSPERVSTVGPTIEKKLIWEQTEPILDLAITNDGFVVLSPSKIALYQQRQLRQSKPIAARAWPRDLRGRLRLGGGRLQVFLPGVECTGALVDPQLTIDCHPSDEPWVLESGSRAILLAAYAQDRNYFDGHVILQNGSRKSVPPFYSAAAVEDAAGIFWLLAGLDGRAAIYDPAFEPVANTPVWGSDLVGVSGRCAGGSAVFATLAGDATEPDAVQPYSILNRTPVALGVPASFNGPVTALWPSSPSSALAVVHDLATGKYAAYVLTLACNP
ncbi:MAG TPA: hypothetical protein VLY24_22305 [Bryobacteraceae bacterium]|nr:hypothetical protein [Bryobacteraceae bacterium]